MQDFRSLAGVILAAVAVAVAGLLRGALTPVLGVEGVPFLTFFPAIAVVTVYAGVVPGAVATLLACGIADYYWLPPVGAFAPTTPREYVSLSLFLMSAAIIIAVCESHRRARLHAHQHAERLQESQRQAVEQATVMTRLQALGNRCAAKDADLQECLQEIVETAIVLTRADKGNLQVLDDDHQTLRIVAHRGFGAPFLSFFATVDASEASACGAAMRSKNRTIVDDVAHSDIFAGQPSLDVLLSAGVRAVQSTPLVSGGGTLIGMVSTHFASPHRPSEEQLRWMNLLARQAADFLERKRKEEDLTRLNTILAEADRRKTEFLATLSHELRNPLSAISGAVSVLKAVGDPEERPNRAHEVIGRQVEHLARLVDDLLDVSRVSTAKVIVNKRSLDLADPARQTMSQMRSAGRFDAHRVTSDLASVWINGDEARIAQVLTNLVDNALKYTPSRGNIVVRVRPEDDRAVMEVSDSGIGIEPRLIGQLFEPFVQGDPAPGRAPSGLGIGLTLVKNLVDLHGGTVEVRSEGVGKGAVVRVILPSIARPEPDHEGDMPKQTRPARRLRILVVEDNADAREMLRTALTLDGHEVKEAADGASGLDILRAYQPDVALIDVGLPGIDGYELARKARGTVGKMVRLVALTGYGSAEDRRRALEAGFDAHLVKPIDPSALAAVLRPPGPPSLRSG